MQPVREPRCHDVAAEVGAGIASTSQRPQARAVAARPPPVVPWARNEIIEVLRVVSLEQLVNLLWAVKVLLVPPAGYVQVGNGWLLHVRGEHLLFPEAVVIGMTYEIIPRRNIAVEIAR